MASVTLTARSGYLVDPTLTTARTFPGHQRGLSHGHGHPDGERVGSLDTAIHEERGNDFTSFLAAHPAIHTICFNGAKSYQCFRRYNRPLLSRAGLAFHQLPSTSPANAKWRLPMLADAWGEALLGKPPAGKR